MSDINAYLKIAEQRDGSKPIAKTAEPWEELIGVFIYDLSLDMNWEDILTPRKLYSLYKLRRFECILKFSRYLKKLYWVKWLNIYKYKMLTNHDVLKQWPGPHNGDINKIPNDIYQQYHKYLLHTDELVKNNDHQDDEDY
jgi:hypothetical protein